MSAATSVRGAVSSKRAWCRGWGSTQIPHETKALSRPLASCISFSRFFIRTCSVANPANAVDLKPFDVKAHCQFSLLRLAKMIPNSLR